MVKVIARIIHVQVGLASGSIQIPGFLNILQVEKLGQNTGLLTIQFLDQRYQLNPKNFWVALFTSAFFHGEIHNFWWLNLTFLYISLGDVFPFLVVNNIAISGEHHNSENLQGPHVSGLAQHLEAKTPAPQWWRPLPQHLEQLEGLQQHSMGISTINGDLMAIFMV